LFTAQAWLQSCTLIWFQCFPLLFLHTIHALFYSICTSLHFTKKTIVSKMANSGWAGRRGRVRRKKKCWLWWWWCEQNKSDAVNCHLRLCLEENRRRTTAKHYISNKAGSISFFLLKANKTVFVCILAWFSYYIK
jgi:hypothetical protein